MFFEVVCSLVLLVLTTFLWAVWYGRRNYGILEDCGFPVIPPTLFLGSDPTFYKDVQHLKDIERFHKYGPVWGMYLGALPQVYVADPELIRLILVKDYDYFHSRRPIEFGTPFLDGILGFQNLGPWKILRSSLTPLFTTGKLKTMTEGISAHAQEYVQDLSAECAQTGRLEKFDCRIRLTAWLIDMFAQSTLGIQLENRKDPDNDFALAFRKLMGEGMEYNFLYSLSMTFPFLTALAPTFVDSATKVIEGTVRHVMESRRKAKETNGTDLVDLLNGLMSKVDSEEFRKLGITEINVIAQAFIFFIGGYETTSTTLSHFFYYIAKYPEIQDRLHAELLSKFGSAGLKTDIHDSLKEENVPYLTACLNESLRLGSTVLRPERICNKDWSGGGIRIKKGTAVMIPAWAAHRNPKAFPNPNEFKPERFLAENKSEMDSYGFVGFGNGPKICIGMRFAYDSIKAFLVPFLLNFKVEIRADTALNYKSGATLFIAFDPVYLDVVKRV